MVNNLYVNVSVELSLGLKTMATSYTSRRINKCHGAS
jgi:hypothetical protein